MPKGNRVQWRGLFEQGFGVGQASRGSGACCRTADASLSGSSGRRKSGMQEPEALGGPRTARKGESQRLPWRVVAGVEWDGVVG